MTGVIFDADGVLFDSMPIWMQAGEAYLKKKGKQGEEKLGEKLFSMSMEEGARYLKEKWQLPDTVEVICKEINQVVADAYEHTIPLKAGVKETLRSLVREKIPLVIATSSDEPIVRAALQRLGISAYFPKIVTCTEMGAGKSRPDVFLVAAEYIESVAPISGKNRANIYVVEDSLVAAKTAKQAGFTVVGVYDEASSREWDSLCQVADSYARELKAELFL